MSSHMERLHVISLSILLAYSSVVTAEPKNRKGIPLELPIATESQPLVAKPLIPCPYDAFVESAALGSIWVGIGVTLYKLSNQSPPEAAPIEEETPQSDEKKKENHETKIDTP